MSAMSLRKSSPISADCEWPAPMPRRAILPGLREDTGRQDAKATIANGCTSGSPIWGVRAAFRRARAGLAEHQLFPPAREKPALFFRPVSQQMMHAQACQVI